MSQQEELEEQLVQQLSEQTEALANEAERLEKIERLMKFKRDLRNGTWGEN